MLFLPSSISRDKPVQHGHAGSVLSFLHYSPLVLLRNTFSLTFLSFLCFSPSLTFVLSFFLLYLVVPHFRTRIHKINPCLNDHFKNVFELQPRPLKLERRTQ
uniref:Uncharacterized protein n=1 Tax=Sinocyclocheilus rhinocerous TaxID=307959 RepID=A0A673K082_9TELE